MSPDNRHWLKQLGRALALAFLGWAVLVAVLAGAGRLWLRLPSHADLAAQFSRARPTFEAIARMAEHDRLQYLSVRVDDTRIVPPLSPERVSAYRELFKSAGVHRFIHYDTTEPEQFGLAGSGWLKTNHAGVLYYPEGVAPLTPEEERKHCADSARIEGRWYTFHDHYCHGSP